MDLRFAQPDDIEEIAALWVDAFPGKRTLADRVRMLETGGPYGGLETVLVARADAGRLAGACKIYRMTQYLRGVALPMMGLAAVAVAPDARRRGLGATLCTAAMREARDRGDVLSTLYPFRPDYYERLGWGLVGHLLKHRFRTAHLPDYDEAGHVRPAVLPDDADDIAACYARVAARSNGPIARDRRIWAYRLAGEELGVRPVDEDAALAAAGEGTGKDRVVVCDDGGVTGYMLLRMVPGRVPETGRVHVRELVAEDEEAYRALVGHLAAQRDQWPFGLHFARPGERFEDRLEDPRPPRYTPSRSLHFPTATVVRGPMVRVLDVQAALATRPFSLPGGATLTLTVADAQLPENGGPWIVEGAREAGVRATPGSDASSAASLDTDAATFARIMAGEVAPSTAARLGRARTAGDAALLDRVFAAATPFWLPDEF